MNVHVWGTDFRRSTPELRSELFIPMTLRARRLRTVLEFGFKDLFYLSTCNRVEFYTTAETPFCDTRKLWVKLLEYFGLSADEYFRGYHLEGKAAVRHLMRLASSLESLVVGEPQVLGQIKQSHQWTRSEGLPLQPALEKFLGLSYQTAKVVRSRTEIGEKSVSVSSLALSHIQGFEDTLPLESVVVVGRSPISIPILKWMLEYRPATKVLWVNRTVERLSVFPESECVKVRSLESFLDRPCDFSHLFTATSSLEPLFTDRFFERLPVRPRVVVDLALPPDVVFTKDPPQGLRLLHMEDLSEEAKCNAQGRAAAVEDAERIIEQALRDYCMEEKATPHLKDFNHLEPFYLEDLAGALQSLCQEIPVEWHPKLERWAEKLVKRNLHRSREHLREVIQKVSGIQAP